ncbi:NAD(P)+ transhydrogenase beta chain [Martelella mediterranea]|uniref:NAD(P)+ transhydrogenase beta chain n=1 Tax=Martelella mediterranea TaxID=293089 RepID=A0A4R3NMA8_9HYPH|nr:NAD(P)+ transhydrogenase beta chain [Martelella mediterranea]TCT35391.1 hypothetical protein EDC90_102646 [Martelella mediterranea]
MEKPSYRSSKRFMGISHALAWAVIFIIVAASSYGSDGALALAPTVIPLMVGMILALLGIHRGLGSVDMRTIARFGNGEPDKET